MTKHIIGLRSGALNQLKLSEASYARLNHHNRVQEFSCPRGVRRKYYEVLGAVCPLIGRSHQPLDGVDLDGYDLTRAAIDETY
jgi:hypothetical protein